jgi:hypothetical protein
MKPESTWQFSAPLAKVDLPRIVNEAADVDGALGAIKVVVDISPTEAIAMVLADSDLAAFAHKYRGIPLPSALLSNETELIRNEFGVLSGPHVRLDSVEGLARLLVGGGIVVFQCANEQAADQLIAQLVDRVVVKVEAF